ncbi:hypothetical protein IE81DRAFT_328410 [Ceraceosorus guamensis]|uniref:Pirin-like protein n=1 Tax=Ceraceosorus guamensis TaxID=1522189 RepID=A0A316W4Z3_9BASI|nr:hypothetical protein IE81DRAFT_328410 [Ceraceosorus guamensis]PWN44812.1 hypothetical protein IE81DRAFT_328410 [Ceraceosorus guamensis]
MILPKRNVFAPLRNFTQIRHNTTTCSSMTQVSRRVVQEVPAVETPEGAGAVVRRSIGTPALRNLSPFLMLDHFRIGEGAGFPDHPHRGMTTVTYMLSGQVQHEDFAGHAGTIGPGSLQWMTAGRGIVHAEMPLHRDPKTNAKLEDPIGLQLWIDLPQEMKSSEPFYQESAAEAIPTALPRADQAVDTEGKGWSIKVISGESHGVQSKVRTPDRGHCWYFDVRLSPGGRVFQEIPPGWTAFIYHMGTASVRIGSDAASTLHPPFTTLVLGSQDATQNGAWVEHAGDVQEEARFVIIAGEPLKQNVVQHGPFVMTSKADIYQAFQDYAGGKNGFERAPGWRSKIG